MMRRVVLFLALLFAALASGGAFVVYLAYNPAGMSAAFYVETMQHGIRSLVPLAVALNLGLFFTVVSAALARRDRPTLYLLVGASLCILAAVLLTVLGNWPINNQIITWSVNFPAPNWTELRDAWWRFHVARAVLHITGFGLLVLSTLLRGDLSRPGGMNSQ